VELGRDGDAEHGGSIEAGGDGCLALRLKLCGDLDEVDAAHAAQVLHAGVQALEVLGAEGAADVELDAAWRGGRGTGGGGGK
jgi:hypothetical protein